MSNGRSNRAVTADEEILKQFGCMKRCVSAKTSHLLEQSVDIFRHPSGWEFTSLHATILNEQQLGCLAGYIRRSLRERYLSTVERAQREGERDREGEASLEVNGCKLHLPPMAFCNDLLTASYGGTEISISPADSLVAYCAQHTAEYAGGRPVCVIKVPHAKKWTQKLQLDGFGSNSNCKAVEVYGEENEGTIDLSEGRGKALTSTKDFDWTYSSDYCLSLSQRAVLSSSQADTDVVNSLINTTRLLFDGEEKSSEWTKCSERFVFNACEVSDCLRREEKTTENQTQMQVQVQGDGITSVIELGKTQSIGGERLGLRGSGWSIEGATGSGIDYALLRQTDQPILFYDQMVLYQDDLEDCGEVSFEAKIRVMPDCWFLLSKLFMRVDDVLARSRETRLFHRFSEVREGESDVKRVHMEVVWREMKLTPPPLAVSLAANALPNAADSKGTRLPPPPPAHPSVSGNNRVHKDNAHVMPEVNSQEGIKKFFTLSFFP